MRVIRRATIVAILGFLALANGSMADAQLGLGNQMAPPYTTYSPTFPTYQPAPVIGGFQQTYNPPTIYTPPPVPQTYPKYLAPGAGCVGHIGVGC